MTETFRGLIDAFGDGWERSDVERICSVFTPDAVFHETPFRPEKKGAGGGPGGLWGAPAVPPRARKWAVGWAPWLLERPSDCPGGGVLPPRGGFRGRSGVPPQAPLFPR